MKEKFEKFILTMCVTITVILLGIVLSFLIGFKIMTAIFIGIIACLVWEYTYKNINVSIKK